MSENIEKIKSVLKDKYEIERLINEGGMGEIYGYIRISQLSKS